MIKLIKDIRRKHLRDLASTKPMRPYGIDYNDAKAVEYARWLAARDGIDLPRGTKGIVSFASVTVARYKSSILRAMFVRFGNVQIDIPNWRFDDTAPAVEMHDD